MPISRQQTPSTLFSTEHECVVYLFKKRWPGGFVCPFCNRLQPETAPAYRVVCRDCRKQTSITAHTVMHGTRNSLISWMLVAWQFCNRDQGISARETQRLLALSSYQTAWTWLQKIRLGAALAQSAPCAGTVVFDTLPLLLNPSGRGKETALAIAMETQHRDEKPGRILFGLPESTSPEALSAIIDRLVMKDSTLFIRDTNQLNSRLTNYICRKPHPYQHKIAEKITTQATDWLASVYCRTINSGYLQSYLDEFSFRYNTAGWSSRLLVFEHLLDGLLSDHRSAVLAPITRKNRPKQQTPGGRDK